MKCSSSRNILRNLATCCTRGYSNKIQQVATLSGLPQCKVFSLSKAITVCGSFKNNSICCRIISVVFFRSFSRLFPPPLSLGRHPLRKSSVKRLENSLLFTRAFVGLQIVYVLISYHTYISWYLPVVTDI